MKKTIVYLCIITMLSCTNPSSGNNSGDTKISHDNTANTQIVGNKYDNTSKKNDTKSGTRSIPDETIIANDLIGRKITEGRDNGYFDSDWVWTIENGEISNLKILNRTVEIDYCTFFIEMVLKDVTRPIRYKATIQVEYSLIDNRWVISMLQSKGVDVVKTGRYDNCISTKIGDDGWGGVDCLKIKNNTDVPLLVGGIFRTSYSDSWRKFSAVVEGLQIIGIGGTFGGGSVVDYEIHFVEQY